MSLREQVAEAIADEAYDWLAPQFKQPYRQRADAAIAAFEQALLSDEVVEAVAEVVHQKNWQGAYTPFEWDEEIDDIRSAIMLDARAALQAALAAMTGTEGSE